MSNKIKVKPIIAIVCDDVREEKTGKTILIGIYTGGINLTKPETAPNDAIFLIHLALWMPLEIQGIGKKKIQVKVGGAGQDDYILDAVAEAIELKPHELKPFSLTGLPMNFTKDGDFIISFKTEDDSDWQVVKTIPVSINKHAA